MRRRTRSSGFEVVDAAIAQRSAAPTIVRDEMSSAARAAHPTIFACALALQRIP
jgi:hypothetical protein